MAEVGEPFISEMYALNTDTMQVCTAAPQFWRNSGAIL